MSQQTQEERELLELEIKLARLKIAASHLKQKKLKEQKSARSLHIENLLLQLAEIGSKLSADGLVKTAALMPLAKKHRFGALLAAAAWQFWQQAGRKR
ncbi:hypothetical protein L4G92_06130 [Neisseria sp. ZJ106]|uniref:Uncharacterized protein n=1 Tax=Neisseria lisongii TaxID=2912188 RepID=A0AAW5AHW5_9NEIS|nr:hypothetical protein [Neisseria lisongii]MCF7521624.1 hypothetical protein [Neisseria lisongii]MCF7529402.1 hypothetical protein [Neisseria lisongii]WCL70860.1 hypothetical protein PJU73_05665 [Neisseria lisongii]